MFIIFKIYKQINNIIYTLLIIISLGQFGNAVCVTCVGKALTKALCPMETLLPPEKEESENFFIAFFKGFANGIKASFEEDLKLFGRCKESPENLVKLYKQLALNFTEGVDLSLGSQLLQGLSGTVQHISSCITLGFLGYKFIELSLNFSLEEVGYALIRSTISNFQIILQNLALIPAEFFHGASDKAGFHLGQLVYIIIIH